MESFICTNIYEVGVKKVSEALDIALICEEIMEKKKKKIEEMKNDKEGRKQRIFIDFLSWLQLKIG